MRGFGDGNVISRDFLRVESAQEDWYVGWWTVCVGFGGGDVVSHAFPRVETGREH